MYNYGSGYKRKMEINWERTKEKTQAFYEENEEDTSI